MAGAYRAWRKGLKNKPKPERMRAKWDELKSKTYKRYAVDPETAQIRLISLATEEVNAAVDVMAVEDVGELLDALQGKTLLAHNAPFDLGVLRERYGYVHEGCIVDTQLLGTLLHYAADGEPTAREGKKFRLPDPHETKVEVVGRLVGMTSLAYLVDKYLKVKLDKAQQAEDWSLPKLPAAMIDYSLKDSRILIPLAQELGGRLSSIGMNEVVEDIEARALPAQISMERNGMPASREVAIAMAERYRQEAERALGATLRLVGGLEPPADAPWSWSKSRHILRALKGLGADLTKLPKTSKAGEPSTSKDALQKLQGPEQAREWVKRFLEYKELQKRSCDFADKYAQIIRPNGTIPASFSTVSTGRYNCRRPNLQQVPKRGELQTREGMRIRDVFRARDGEKLVVADFEQVELLLAATIAERESGTPSRMLEVFRDGKADIHRATAAAVLGKASSKVTKNERSLAKAINFGLIYGCSAERLLDSAVNSYGVKDMTLKDAKRYRKAFFAKYPEFSAWHKKVSEDCRYGVQYAVTPKGRRRKLPVWAESGDVAFTTAVNHPVQGAGADAIKLTLARLFEDRHNCPGRPELRCAVHDEVILTVAAEHADEARAWVEKHMAVAEREAVRDPESPIAVDIKTCDSWGG